MPRKTFEASLEDLNVELIKMGAIVENAINSAIIALKNNDDKLAKEVVDQDRVIDDMEKDIEAKCLSLILRQQPVACDLRVVSTALKMVTDMERIGDQAADIAELVMGFKSDLKYKAIEHIPAMAEAAVSMVHGAIAAFVNNDMEAAREIIKKDDIVDELFEKVKSDVSLSLQADVKNCDMDINFLMIAKYLERIGDHAENICEWIEFSETGDYKNEKLL
ncbi:MAG: phosphate signaling complex protein PhoU [Lachnospirales bacterium]